MEDRKDESGSVEGQTLTMSFTLVVSWFKKNLVKILLVILMVLVLILVAAGWWLKIRGFKVADLLSRLQMADAKNEVNHLETRKALLKQKGNYLEEDMAEIERKIKSNKKKTEKAKLKIQGLGNEEIARRLSDLGF